jgi:hypothetical protein
MKMNSGTVRCTAFNDLESVGGLYTENDFRRPIVTIVGETLMFLAVGQLRLHR